jgi:transposase
VLANDIDYVIGVDTHKDSHSAAVLNATGGVISALDVTTSEAGYRRLLALANRQAVGRRAWAVEGTGSYIPLKRTMFGVVPRTGQGIPASMYACPSS